MEQAPPARRRSPTAAVAGRLGSRSARSRTPPRLVGQDVRRPRRAHCARPPTARQRGESELFVDSLADLLLVQRARRWPSTVITDAASHPPALRRRRVAAAPRPPARRRHLLRSRLAAASSSRTQTAGVFVNTEGAIARRSPIGDAVEVEGETDTGGFAPSVTNATDARRAAAAAAGPRRRRPSLDALRGGRLRLAMGDGRAASSGASRPTRRSTSSSSCGPAALTFYGQVPAFTGRCPSTWSTRVVTVQAVAGTIANSRRQMTGVAALRADARAHQRRLAGARRSVPTPSCGRSTACCASARPSSPAAGCASRGTVTLVRGNRRLPERRHRRARGADRAEPPDCSVGALVDAVGFPDHRRLRHDPRGRAAPARRRRAAPVEPLTLNPTRLAGGAADAQLVEIDARLVERVTDAGRSDAAPRCARHGLQRRARPADDRRTRSSALQPGSQRARPRHLQRAGRRPAASSGGAARSRCSCRSTAASRCCRRRPSGPRAAPWRWSASSPASSCSALAWVMVLRTRVATQTHDLRRGEGVGGGREPRQERVRGQHEPRDPHADERRPGHGRAPARRRRSSPDQKQYLDTVRSSASTLLRVINDVLDFSKIEAGRLELTRTPFDVRALLRESLPGLALRGAPQGHRPRLARRARRAGVAGRRSPSGCGQVARQPGRQRRQVHRDAARSSSASRVARRRRGGADGRRRRLLDLSVTDTGIGIAAEKQALVFDAFTQADGSTSRALRRHRPRPVDLRPGSCR